jgi:ABC-type dipeptide/oligopeptide/nickel transport system permease component
MLYLNDLNPISIYNESNTDSRIYLDSTKYQYAGTVQITENRSLVFKWPYLSRSYRTDRNVSEIIAEAMPGTAVLAIVAILCALIFGLALGVLAAVKKGSVFDNLAIFLSVLGMSGPSFFMAILIAWLGGLVWYEVTYIPALPVVFLLLFLVFSALFNKFGSKNQPRMSVAKWALYGLVFGGVICAIGWMTQSPYLAWSNGFFTLPGTGLPMTGSLYEVDIWEGRYLEPRNLILPAITLGIRPLAVIVQLTRSSLLEELGQDYIRTARAKGLKERKVVLRHALRNALNPVVTAVSGWFASLLAGAVFVEFVFGYKGLGMEIFTALEKDDLPVVMGAVIVIASVFVVINILVDLIYGWLDPRARITARE